MQGTFLWHDYETFGTDPGADRPAQFAAVRTNLDLEEAGQPVMIHCSPPNDMLPHPGACLVTGITPQRARRLGVSEAAFAARIQEEMAEPGTCIAGYNNIRFDDHFTRNLFYRNFFDPYRHEYADGNSRFDLINLARMYYALRPQGIEWPLRDNGAPSFRLEDLTQANGIAHEGAHDALSDVRATIGLARLLKKRQPKLFDWALGLREQKRSSGLLNTLSPEPVVHTSARFSATRGCTSLVLPLCVHPRFRKSVVVYDLMSDPSLLLASDAGVLHDLVFTPRADLPEGVERVPLKEIKTNGVPMVAPAGVLQGVDCERIGLDVGRCRDNAERILAKLPAVRTKVMDLYATELPPPPVDPDLQLYSGDFFSSSDRALMDRVRRAPPERLAADNWPFRDPRLPEMLFRYRARNFPATLSSDEAAKWDEWRLSRLLDPPDERILGRQRFCEELAMARLERPGDDDSQVLLDHIEAWVVEIGLPACKNP